MSPPISEQERAIGVTVSHVLHALATAIDDAKTPEGGALSGRYAVHVVTGPGDHGYQLEQYDYSLKRTRRSTVVYSTHKAAAEDFHCGKVQWYIWRDESPNATATNSDNHSDSPL